MRNFLFAWARGMVIEFLANQFDASNDESCASTLQNDVYSCIAMSVLSSITIMIVGRRPNKKSGIRTEVGVFSQTMAGKDDVAVIAAVTYRNGAELECGSSLVIWMAVSKVLDNMPSVISSWRRQGFGRLLLTMVIKLSTIGLLSRQGIPHNDESLPGVDIYAQLSKDPASAFFASCGFVRINDTTSSGFALLPKSISDAIGDEQGNEAYVWLARSEVDKSMLEGHDTIALLRLPSGCLLNTTYPDSAKLPPKAGSSVQPAKPTLLPAKKLNVGGIVRAEPPALVDVPMEVVDVDSTTTSSDATVDRKLVGSNVAYSQGGKPLALSEVPVEVIELDDRDGSDGPQAFVWCN